MFDARGLKLAMPAFFLLVLTWALYGQSLGFAYVWDDGIIFLDKNDLMVEPLSWRLIAQPVLDGTTYFRPLVFLTWFGEFHLFGQNPFVSHAINVALFSLNVLLVYWLAKEIFTQAAIPNYRRRAWLAATFYAVHPAMIQSVAWVSGRFDVMCTTFCLLACYIFICRDLNEWLKAFVVALCLLLALFSKELGVVLPFLLLCVGMAASSTAERGLSGIERLLTRERKSFAGLIIAGVVYGVVRTATVETFYHSPINGRHFELILTTMLPMAALKEYALLAVVPFGRISLFYPYGDLDWIGTFNGLAYLLMFVFLIYAFWRAVWGGKVWAWMLMASLAGIGLVLHIVPLSIFGSLVQDRFMTLPLAFLGMSAASVQVACAVRLGQWISPRASKLSVGIFIAGWLTMAALVTLTTIPVWKTPLNLWAWAHHASPDASFVSYNYVQAALMDGRPELAEKEIERLREKKGGLDVPEQMLYANLLTRKGDPEAIKYMEGIMYALPDFQSLEDGKQSLRMLGLTPVQVGGAFMDYANAKMVFEGDLDTASRYNRMSEWYFQPSQRVPAALQRASIEYLRGDFEQAKVIIDLQKDIYFYNKKLYMESMGAAIAVYCRKWVDKNENTQRICAELRSEVLPEAFGEIE